MGMFGLTNPMTYPTQQTTPWGFNPYAGQGTGLSPLGLINPIGPSGINPFATQQYWSGNIGGAQNLQQILPQVVQLLQTVPQQVQQVQQLQQLQQHQLQQLQQILQIIPAQLQQLQQLIQYVPQQIQHLQQTSQPFGHNGLGGFSPWAVTPQSFGAQSGHVM
jgi:hypothetical protein